MTCQEIMEQIERDFPKSYAMEWDNVGLLAGRAGKEIRSIYIGLDATGQVIREAVREKADLLLTHHPLIFQGLKCVTDQDFIGERVLTLMRNDISYYAMHTNYDVVRMGALAAERLGWSTSRPLEPVGKEEGAPGLGQIAKLEQEITLEELSRQVKEAFGLPDVRVFGDPRMKVERAAILPGAGKSAIPSALAQSAKVLVTGDVGHHEGIDAAAQGLAVIDAGHYGIEHIFVEDLSKYAKEHFPEARVITEPVRHPFWTI
ncbi:MAG TPA: Nif3-like dinuclear metal center hexameric protein [Candidatus Dorea gallistercoris]|uniref:GTP cyclohydrolase 1 type 2 homolog n=1 Tax=Candidatus Dorea gallistercoris TaxID=2838542 RepID=A0A9D1RBY9_9FIRM|nr:Nif3-like dinuclear metal center hexameric protein [Candidatus Dorea gallistercoris]